MHTLFYVNKALYTETIRGLIKDAAHEYDKTCYISFNDPFNIVVRFFETIHGLDLDKFIIVDSSGKEVSKKSINMQTYVVPIHDVFRTYLFLRDIIREQNVQHIFIDSLSALIHRFSDMPLKRMISDLLLEVGQYKCDTSMVVFHEHLDHDIVQGLSPFIGKNVRL